MSTSARPNPEHGVIDSVRPEEGRSRSTIARSHSQCDSFDHNPEKFQLVLMSLITVHLNHLAVQCGIYRGLFEDEQLVPARGR
jgi:hypothetical protein